MSDLTPAIRGELVPDFQTGQLALLDDAERVMRLPVSEIRILALDLIDAAGGMLRKIKRAAGIVAMAAEKKMKTTEYAEWALDYADLLGIHPRTLKRWKEDALKERGSHSVLTRKSTSEARKDILSAGNNPSTAPSVDPRPSDEDRENPSPLTSSPAATSPQVPPPAGNSGPGAEEESRPPLGSGRTPSGLARVPAGEGAPAAVVGPLSTGAPASPSGTAERQAPDVQQAPVAPPSVVPDTRVGQHDLKLLIYPQAGDTQTVVRWLTARSGSLNKITDRDLDALEQLVKDERRQRAAAALIERQKQRMAEPGYRDSLIKPPREFSGPIPKVKGGK